MVDEIKGSGNGNEWKTIDEATKSKKYKEVLDNQINSILNGNETISAAKLRENSLFSKLSDEALKKFNYIAGIDGDDTSFNAEELRVLLSLADASLKKDKFVFDGQCKVDKKSGLEQADDKEVETMIKNLTNSNARKRIKTVDVSKYDRNQDFAQKVSSSDGDEAMLALQDKLQTGFVDKRTGKNVSLLQAIVMFRQFSNDRNRDYDVDVTEAFEQETGIKISNFKRLRSPGDGDSFVIGDWKYDCGKITNSQTGESLDVNTTLWRNSKTKQSVPSAMGWVCMVQNYNDGKGTVIKYNYDENNSDCIAPTSANVNINGEQKTVNYGNKFSVDKELYNFEEFIR